MTSAAQRRAFVQLVKLVVGVLAFAGVLFAYVYGIELLLGKWWALGLTFGPVIVLVLVGMFWMLVDDEVARVR